MDALLELRAAMRRARVKHPRLVRVRHRLPSNCASNDNDPSHNVINLSPRQNAALRRQVIKDIVAVAYKQTIREGVRLLEMARSLDEDAERGER